MSKWHVTDYYTLYLCALDQKEQYWSEQNHCFLAIFDQYLLQQSEEFILQL